MGWMEATPQAMPMPLTLTTRQNLTHSITSALNHCLCCHCHHHFNAPSSAGLATKIETITSISWHTTISLPNDYASNDSTAVMLTTALPGGGKRRPLQPSSPGITISIKAIASHSELSNGGLRCLNHVPTYRSTTLMHVTDCLMEDGVGDSGDLGFKSCPLLRTYF